MLGLILNFSSGAGPELLETTFVHPLLQATLRTTRGKAEGALTHRGTFQWTPAVRALSVLLLRTKALSLTNDKNRFAVVQANSRGAVSALDYALGRHAAWISDMFGVDRNGHVIARRMFKRSNPERKRPGPVAITLNQKFLPLSVIDVRINNISLTQAQDLAELASRIADQDSSPIEISTVHSLNSSTHREFPNGDALVNLKPAFVQEVRSMLRATDIFSPRALREAVTQLRDTPALQPVHRELSSAIEENDLKLAQTERLGLKVLNGDLAQLFPRNRPLRFGVTPSQIGTLAVLRYLRDVRKLPVEIDYNFAHTSDLAHAIASGGGNEFPDCCVMTSASFLLVQPKMRREFSPSMIMPAATHSIMGQRSEAPHVSLAKSAEYLLLCEFPTTPLFWFDALRNSGVISHARTTHLGPDETLGALRGGDPDLRAILWFPYNVIAESMTNLVPLMRSPALGAGLGFIQNILFTQRAVFANSSCQRILNSLIRDAWLMLLENQELCSSLVSNQLDEANYQRALWRYSGLYRVEGGMAA